MHVCMYTFSEFFSKVVIVEPCLYSVVSLYSVVIAIVIGVEDFLHYN